VPFLLTFNSKGVNILVMRQTTLNNYMKIEKLHHIIYFTEDDEGNYYLGRHSTQNLNDGYKGSGNWVRNHPNPEKLRTRIAEHLPEFNALELREDVLLKEHYGKPGCMNETPCSKGFAPGDLNPMKDPVVAAKISGEEHWSHKDPEKYREKFAGDAHWMNKNPEAKQIFLDNHPNKDGRNAKLAMDRGTHVNLTNNPSVWRSAAGIHHWQNGNSPNKDGVLNQLRIEEGTHNFLGPELNAKRIKEGTHNFLGSDGNLKRLAEGTHPSQSETTCLCCTWTVPTSMFKRWHGDNCHMNPKSKRYNPKLKPRIKNSKSKGEAHE
jgi:hypothetical protein